MALIKIVTLFAGLWTGVVVAFIDDGHVTLNADAGPSLLLLVISVVVAGKWLRSLSPDEGTYIRPTLTARPVSAYPSVLGAMDESA